MITENKAIEERLRMLMRCPECELQVSDKAVSCPHCGYPMKADTPPRKSRSKNHKRRRLPNGFGQISEIKNRNLRNPFRAMVSVGKTDTGRPICKPLKPEAFFPTYNDAYAALVEYNKNPYDLAPSITVKELYERWTEEYFKTRTDSSARAIDAAWIFCSAVYNMRAIDLRARHIKGCMEEGVGLIGGKEKLANAVTQSRIKSLFNLMLDYALEYELVERNYARSFTLSEELVKEVKTVKKEHMVFTGEEISLLWEHAETKRLIDAVLIQCYSGWRPQEVCQLEIENIDLDNWTFKGGMKTEAGIDRIVPIHSRIQPLVLRAYKEAEALGSKYLFNNTYPNSTRKDTMVTYEMYQRRFTQFKNELKLNPDHRPHDGRTHFVTAAKKCGVDEYAIKYLIGHKISDITERVYTQREFDWLREEIEKIE